MRKNVSFATLFLYNLALITHDATKSMNPSINITVALPLMSSYLLLVETSPVRVHVLSLLLVSLRKQTSLILLSVSTPKNFIPLA